MTADGSMAVWAVRKNGVAGKATADVHFNYWRMKKDVPASRWLWHKLDSGARSCWANIRRSERGWLARVRDKDFVEIGINLREASEVEEIFIYLPGKNPDWYVQDCGPYFLNQDIAHGIFNLPLSSTSTGAPGPQRIALNNRDGSLFCHVHILSDRNSKKIDPLHLQQTASNDGTLLKITPHALQEACYQNTTTDPVYFRLRAYYIGPAKNNPFVKTIEPNDRHFQTGYVVVDYLDFRLNEVRSLPSHIESAMRASPDTLAIKLVAFLTAVPVQSDVTTMSFEKAHKKRMLEKTLWKQYVPSGIPRGMTVYHWKEEAGTRPGIEDFSGFVKMQTRLVSWSLLTSIIIAFTFGVFGNLLASYIWDRMHPAPTSCPSQTIHSENCQPIPQIPGVQTQTPNDNSLPKLDTRPR